MNIKILSKVFSVIVIMAIVLNLCLVPFGAPFGFLTLIGSAGILLILFLIASVIVQRIGDILKGEE